MNTKHLMFFAVMLLIAAATSCSEDPDVPTGTAFYGTGNAGGGGGGGNSGGGSSGTYNGHDYVDLDLPSGTLWATCNVGASSPEEYGDYFAWGETTTKSNYNWDTYQYYNSSITKYTGNDGLTTLQAGDDAATTNWGSGWCMPTRAQWEELLNNTTVTWTTQNGVNGSLFTASNGNSLFLPAAGYRKENYLNDEGSDVYYWSSSLCTDFDYSETAWILRFYSDNNYMDDRTRHTGLSVRAVFSAQN